VRVKDKFKERDRKVNYNKNVRCTKVFKMLNFTYFVTKCNKQQQQTYRNELRK